MKTDASPPASWFFYQITPGLGRRMLREMTPKRAIQHKTRRNPKGFAICLQPTSP